MSLTCYAGLVSAHTQNQMDKELHHTRGALHMEAFTDAQMWGFSERGEKMGEAQTKHSMKHREKDRKKDYFMGFILGAASD